MEQKIEKLLKDCGFKFSTCYDSKTTKTVFVVKYQDQQLCDAVLEDKTYTKLYNKVIQWLFENNCIAN